MESISGLTEKGPITSEWDVFDWLSLKHGIFNNNDTNTCWTDILLGSCIHNIVFSPVDRFRTEIAGHINNEKLALWNYVEWEIVELKTLDSLVVTVMEKGRVLFYFPFRRIRNKSVLVSFVVCYFVCIAILLRLSNC